MSRRRRHSSSLAMNHVSRSSPRATQGLGDEHVLKSGAVRSVSDRDDLEALRGQRPLDFGSGPETQCRVRRQSRPVSSEHILVAERHQRERDPCDLGPVLDAAFGARVVNTKGCFLRPAFPDTGRRSRSSKTTNPLGRSAFRTEASTSDHSASSRNTCATLPVMVATSVLISGIAVASAWIQRTRSASGLLRAMSSDAAAGSSPATSTPRRAS